MRAAKPCGRLVFFEPPHWSDPLIDASMVLLQVIIQVAVGMMTDSNSQPGSDSAGVGIMSVGRHTFRNTTSDYTGGLEERCCRYLVALLAEQNRIIEP
jgi:hypothetical protein